MDSSTNTAGTGLPQRGRQRGTVPAAIGEAMRSACRDVRDYTVACDLFSDDASGFTGQNVGEARLERAIARTTTDEWARGMASPEDVASAYARLAVKLRAMQQQ